jgi:hypothetical protein
MNQISAKLAELLLGSGDHASNLGPLVGYTLTPRKSGESACQAPLRRFCLIDDPCWLPATKIRADGVHTAAVSLG